MKKEWRIPAYFERHLNRVGLEYLQFTFEQSRKSLEATIYTSERLTDRVHRLTITTVCVLTLLLIYFVAGIDKLSPLYLATCLSIPLCMGALLLLLVRSFHGYDKHQTVFTPESMLKKELVEDFNDEDQKKKMLINECVRCQTVIDHNERLNTQRAGNINAALYIIAFIPFNIIISMAIVNLVPF